MNKKYIVDVKVGSTLTIRAIANGRKIGELQKNEIVEHTGLENGIWYNVKTTNNIFGWVSSEYLKEYKELDIVGKLRFGVDRVHLYGNATRRINANAFCLSEKLPKTRNLFEIATFLDVENTNHKRYKPRKDTFCNIYAHDFAYCLGVYLPRVFWGGDFKKGDFIKVHYPKDSKDKDGNISEQNANMLTDWLKNEGHNFGWGLAANEIALQNKVNEGKYFGVISAKDNNGIGHITVVLPTLNPTDYPLQSQAGRYNKYLFKDNWYRNSKFETVVFGYCRIE